MSNKLISGSVILVVVSIISTACGASLCDCPKKYAPVCASDGYVYPNKCIMDCHSIILKRDLEVVNEGPCAEPTDSNQSCLCKRNMLPVCGTDGVTYDNVCLLRCERLKNPELEVMQQGTCSKRSKRGALYERRYSMHRRAPCSYV